VTKFIQGHAAPNGGTYSGLSSPNDTEKERENGKLLPIETKASSNDESSIEYGKKFLPPLWVDIQEEIEAILKQLKVQSNALLV
jgi:hypothetical protein